VVCRVVNGGSLPTVKGYIEIEFMEQVSDFWRIHQNAEPARVAETVKVSPLIPAPSVAVLTASEPAPTTPVVPLAGPQKEPPSQSDGAPSFDDIVGVVRMSRTSPAPAKPVAPAAPVSVLKSKNEVEDSHGESDFLSTISAPNPVANVTSVDRAIPSAQEFSSLPAREPSPSNAFMAGGMFAAAQTSSASSPTEARGRMPLIIGGLALLLAGFGGGYFYMHLGSTPAPAVSEALAVQPSSPAPSAPPSRAEQVPASRPAAESLPTQAQPVSTVASVTPAAGVSTTAEAQQNLRRAAGSADAKQPDPAPKQRQQISNLIPGLKMKSPSAPKQTLAKLSEGSAPNITDVSSAIAVGGAPGAAMLAPVVRSENQPAPPPSLSPTGPSAKTIREPRLISSTHPTYPSVAKQAGTQGTVVVTAQVDAKGSIADVKAISGPAALRQAAVDSVRQWKYSPALIDGKPASAQITVDVQFRLN